MKKDDFEMQTKQRILENKILAVKVRRATANHTDELHFLKGKLEGLREARELFSDEIPIQP